MKRLLFTVMFLVLVSGCLCGCAQGDRNPFELADQAKALGVKARITAIWGTGHAGGFAYNFTGSNGFIEITVDPAAGIQVVSQPEVP